jgi:hypothetical protein
VIDQAFDQAPVSLAHLKKQSLANLYQYLLFRGLVGPLDRHTGWVAARYLFQALRNDLSVLKRSRLFLVVSLKIVAAILLPSQQAQAVIKALKRRSGKAIIS